VIDADGSASSIILVGHEKCFTGDEVVSRTRHVSSRSLCLWPQKSCKGVTERESAENIHRGFAPMSVGLGVEQLKGNAIWHDIVSPDLHDMRE